MNEFEEFEERIERYLQGEMNDDEAELFMQDLNANEVLRKQYEEELLIRALSYKGSEGQSNTLNLPAVNKEVAKTESTETKKYARRIYFLSARFKYIAAAVLLIVIATAIMLTVQNRNIKQITTTDSGNQRNEVVKDSVQNEQFKNKDSLAESLFKKYYTVYTAKNDPVEISNYYSYYKNREFDKVILANKSDYAIMGIDKSESLLDAYMFLYKGLSYLGNNNNKSAIKSFDSVLNIAGKNEQLHQDAEWYCALTYLKENNFNKSDSILNNIIQSTSSYKSRAKQIIEELKSN